MQFHREVSARTNVIRANRDDAIQIGDQWHGSSLIVTADTLLPEWSVIAVDKLKERDLDPLWQLSPEVVLLGTGPEIRFPSPRLLSLGPARGIGFEVMDTAAACRTYNILVHEDRRVAAALIIARR